MHRARMALQTLFILMCGLFSAGCSQQAALPLQAEQRMTTLAVMMQAAAMERHSLNGFGVVEIQTEPSDAMLLIDGGRLEHDGKELLLPVRAYEFEALWPDGATASRKAFVKGCVGATDVRVEFVEHPGSVTPRIVWDKWERHVTRVVLKHP